MIRTVIAGGLLAGTIAVASAAMAHADPEFKVYGYQGDHDPYAYLAEMVAQGANGSASDAQVLAHTICLARDSGTSEVDLRHRMEQKYTVSESVAVVTGAEFHFCPAYESEE